MIHSPRSRSSTSAADGRASRTMCAISRSRYAPLTGTTTSPSRRAATWATTSSAEVSALVSDAVAGFEAGRGQASGHAA